MAVSNRTSLSSERAPSKMRFAGGGHLTWRYKSVEQHSAATSTGNRKISSMLHAGPVLQALRASAHACW